MNEEIIEVIQKYGDMGGKVTEFLHKYSFDYLIGEALDLVSSKVDKREGSIIYDTTAVWSVQLAMAYIMLIGYYLDTFGGTAQGDYLDLRAGEVGLDRLQASRAVKRGIFTDAKGNPMPMAFGSRFKSISDANPLVYVLQDIHVDENNVVVPGAYRLECETDGTQGNDYVGDLLPIDNIRGLAKAYMDELLIPGQDKETDDNYRYRYFEHVRRKAFGGNIAQYRQWVLEMDGVGAVQVYPTWNGGGTVKISIIGSDYNVASSTLVAKVQEALDPEPYNQQGIGIAPIGHLVTVTTPNEVEINIDAKITLKPGISVGQVKGAIEQKLEQHLLDLRGQFGIPSETNLYRISIYKSRLISDFLQVSGVEDVPSILINGRDGNLILEQTNVIQELPISGLVVLSGV